MPKVPCPGDETPHRGWTVEEIQAGFPFIEPNRLLILNAELHPGRGTVLLLRQAIGF